VAQESDPSFVVEVHSQRSPPENFKVGVKVSLRGEYHRAENIFVAYKISTQCPSRYEASRDVREGNSAAKAPPGTGTRIE
jgi:cytochrome c-type biogenesis protein CcmE